MSRAYNYAKKQRRHSKPKKGHTLREGEHQRRLTPSEKFAEIVHFITTRGEEYVR